MKCDLWIEQGYASDNSLEYIHVNHIIQHYGGKFCQALPGLHAFTGCDYTQAFMGRGKVKPIKILEKPVEFQEAFIALDTSEGITQTTLRSIENFLCKMYGAKRNGKSVDKLLLKKFFAAYKPN